MQIRICGDDEMLYSLEELFDLQMGKTPSRNVPNYWNTNDNKWISIGDLSQSGKYIYETKEYLSDIAVAESGIRIIPANTVIMSFKLSIGKVAITKEEIYSNEAIMAFNDKQVIELLPEYIYYLFRQKDWSVGTNKAVMGKTLNKATLSQMKINVCPMHMQREIVTILNKVSEILDNLKEQITRCDKLIKSRFVEMFGDTVTNSLNWEEHRLDEYIEFLTSGSRGWAKYFVDEENELFITIKNVKNNHISLNEIQYINAPDNKEAERTKVKTGDLLISITADLGRTGVVDKEIADKGAYINQHLSLVRLDQKKVNPLYISHFLETDGGKRQFESKNQNGVKAGLNFEAIKSLNILVPPLEMQNEYLAFVHQVDKLKSDAQKMGSTMQV